MIPFSIVVAVDEKFGIGKDGVMPWQLPGDMKHFKNITTKTQDPSKKNVVIMGRKTWESIPEIFRPLSNRINIVLSRNVDLVLPNDVLRASSLDEAFRVVENNFRDVVEDVFVVGGAQIYAQSIVLSECFKIYLTKVENIYDCDAFFPDNLDSFQILSRSDVFDEDGTRYRFLEYSRKG